MQESSGFSLKKDWIILGAILLITTLIFWLSDLDITLQSLFFDKEKGWYYVETPFWRFLYKYGIFLGYILALGSLFLISFTYWQPKLIFWRRPAMLMVFVVLFGPGILVNLILKDQWGRPRPREITVFAGQEEYCQVAVPNFGGEGKSFPCGHCAIAFYLAVPYLFLRKKYPFWAFTFLILGLSYGFLMGTARIMAGAHFLSDVIWSAGAVWAIALLGMYLLKVDKPLAIPDSQSPNQRKKARRASLIIGIMMPILTVSLLLATPYISNKHFDTSQEILDDANVIITELNQGEVYLSVKDEYVIDYKVNAFGFPNSKLRWDWETGDTCHYRLYATGWFTEIRNHLKISIPQNISHQFIIKEGSFHWEIPDSLGNLELFIELKEGDIFLNIPKEKEFVIENLSESPIENQLQNTQEKGNQIFRNPKSSLKIKVNIGEGTLHLSHL